MVTLVKQLVNLRDRHSFLISYNAFIASDNTYTIKRNRLIKYDTQNDNIIVLLFIYIYEFHPFRSFINISKRKKQQQQVLAKWQMFITLEFTFVSIRWNFRIRWISNGLISISNNLNEIYIMEGTSEFRSRSINCWFVDRFG